MSSTGKPFLKAGYRLRTCSLYFFSSSSTRNRLKGLLKTVASTRSAFPAFDMSELIKFFSQRFHLHVLQLTRGLFENCFIIRQPFIRKFGFLIKGDELVIVLLPDAVCPEKKKVQPGVVGIFQDKMGRQGLVDHLEGIGLVLPVVDYGIGMRDVDEQEAVLMHQSAQALKQLHVIFHRYVLEHIEQSDKIEFVIP